MSTDAATDSPRYSTMDLEECEAFDHEEIEQEMRADGLNPDHETPTYAWLSDHYRGFIAHLSRNFDLSPGDFYAEIGVPPNDDEDNSPFAFVDDPSVVAETLREDFRLEQAGHDENLIRSVVNAQIEEFFDT